jgi:hypothetical protein
MKRICDAEYVHLAFFSSYHESFQTSPYKSLLLKQHVIPVDLESTSLGIQVYFSSAHSKPSTSSSHVSGGSKKHGHTRIGIRRQTTTEGPNKTAGSRHSKAQLSTRIEKGRAAHPQVP